MTLAASSAPTVALVPAVARDAWLALAARIANVGPVPCEKGDAEAWWPDRKQLDGPATHGAVADCHRCPAEAACLAYALAADERFGVWGGTLPEERRAVRCEPAGGCPDT